MSITSEGNQVTDALNGKLTFEQGKNRIIGRDENNIARLIITGNGTEFSMKISELDTDVINADDDDLIFNSDNNIFKIVSKGTTTLTSPNSIGSSSNVSVAFSTGTKPIVFAFASLTPTGTRFPLPIIQPQLTGDPTPGLVAYQVNYEIVTDLLTFYWRDITKAHNITAYITYYLLQETAT